MNKDIIQQIERPKSIKEIIYEKLKEQIISGAFPPGKRLVENQLAELFNVSRTPLREALHRLESECLVKRNKNKNLIVSKLSENEISDIYDLRSVLERKIIKTVASNRSEKNLIKINKIIDETKIFLNKEVAKKETIDKIVLLGNKFHRCLYDIYGNQFYIKTINDLQAQVSRYAYVALRDKKRVQENAKEHIQMAKYIKEKKTDKAESTMKIHIKSALKVTIEQIKKEQEKG